MHTSMFDTTTIAAEPIWLALAGGVTFGFVNSLHCVGMCGPLIASLHMSGGATVPGEARRGGIGYHLARGTAYGMVGALAGGLGATLGLGEIAPGGATFAFVLAAVMVAMAFGLGRDLGGLPLFGRLLRRVLGFARRLPAQWRGAALGLATPLLPCGLLYAAIAISVAAGGVLPGAAAMVGFALGGVPALGVAQWKLGALRERFGVLGVQRLARALMLASAGVLVWRGISDVLHGAHSCCAHGGGL